MNDELKENLNEILSEMAFYFEDNISAKSLTNWIAEANYWTEFSKELHTKSFLHSLSTLVLIPIINIRNKEDRIQILKKELLNLFRSTHQDITRESLVELSKSYLDTIKYMSNIEDYNEFMRITNTLFNLLDKYIEYLKIRG